jgi:iron complex transport system substrate-binding protein
VAGGPASVFVYTLAPEKLLGWNRPLTPEERAYIPSRYANLPTLGRLTGRGNTANVEVMLASRPDVIIDYGVVNPTYVSLADRVQQQTGVPYLLFDGSLSQIPRAYIAAGESLGVGERAKELARYAEGLLAEIDERLAQVPAEKRPLVYYARGPRGLQTGLKGSINVESLERIGARNIAAERMGPGGIVTVSPEQLLAWNPEVVITIDSDFFAAARSDDIWKGVKAIRDGRLYIAPAEPFPWLDFPPSVNRLIGLKWLGRILYPQRFPEDLRGRRRTDSTRCSTIKRWTSGNSMRFSAAAAKRAHDARPSKHGSAYAPTPRGARLWVGGRFTPRTVCSRVLQRPVSG